MLLRSLAVLGTLFALTQAASAQYTPAAGVSAPMVKAERRVYDAKTDSVRVEAYEAKPTADKWGNAQGNNFDLAVDGAFKGQTVAVLHLYIDNTFDFSLPKAALAEKGFSTYRWITNPPSAKELETSLAKASQLWLISGMENKLTPEHVSVIQKFFDAGHGVYIWGDNQPYYTDANIVARALLGTEMRGDVIGDQTVGMHQNGSRSGIVPNHLLTTGIEQIYEGITIATLDPTPDLHPLIYGSAGNLVAAYYDKGGKRAILDGGFTRLYMKWDTAGTARYVKNAAAWLVNAERFGDSVINPEIKTAVTTKSMPAPVAPLAEPAPDTTCPTTHAPDSTQLPSSRTAYLLLGLIAGMLVLLVLPRRVR